MIDLIAQTETGTAVPDWVNTGAVLAVFAFFMSVLSFFTFRYLPKWFDVQIDTSKKLGLLPDMIGKLSEGTLSVRDAVVSSGRQTLDKLGEIQETQRQHYAVDREHWDGDMAQYRTTWTNEALYVQLKGDKLFYSREAGKPDTDAETRRQLLAIVADIEKVLETNRGAK